MLSRDSKILSVASRAALLALTGISVMVGAIGIAATVDPVLTPNSAAEIKAPRPDVRYGWRIRSGASGGAAPTPTTVVVTATLSDPVSACANTSRCTLGWRLNGSPLIPGESRPVTFDASGSSLLTYEGRADALGLYHSEANVTGSPRIDLIMRRVLPELAAGAIVVGPIGTQTLSFWRDDLPAPMTIANGTSEPITLTRAPTARLFRDDGSSTYPNFVADIAATCRDLAIKAGEEISCNLSIPASAGPGRYRLIASAGGGITKATASATDFSLRFHWSYAWLILFAGGLGGAWLEAYQNSGRRRALQLADAQDLSGRAKEAHAAADQVAQRDTCKVLKAIVDALEARMSLLRTSRTADFGPELGHVAPRLQAIGMFAELEKEYDGLGRKDAAKTAYEEALAAVSLEALPQDAAQKLAALKTALDALRPKTRGVTQDSAGTGDTTSLFSMILPAASSNWLRSLVRRNDKFIALATIMLASTIGVVLLWTGNPSWGNLRDVLLALLTGAAGTAAGTLSIKGLVSGYPLGTIPPPR